MELGNPDDDDGDDDDDGGNNDDDADNDGSIDDSRGDGCGAILQRVPGKGTMCMIDTPIVPGIRTLRMRMVPRKVFPYLLINLKTRTTSF